MENSQSQSQSQSDSNTFSVRIVSIDYYMSAPISDFDICYSSFQGERVKEVPVIRIYGSTPAGQKTCLHVHRALPYLYVPCSYISLQTPEEGDMYTRDMAHAIEKALKSKLKGFTGSKRQHVHGCSLVRGRKIYGYHPSEELFVKIYLYHPHEVARVANLLLDGAILDRNFQPHESHIPFLLQFLVDYNLFGMGHLHISKLKFRHPLPDDFTPRGIHQSATYKHSQEKLACVSVNYEADSSVDALLTAPTWTSSTVSSGWMWPSPILTNSSPVQDLHLMKRHSTCELEGDATVDEILNQQFKMYSSLSQTGSEVKMVQSLVPIWEEEYQRTGMQGEMIYSDPSKPHPGDVLKTLLHESEIENALLNLWREAGNSSSSQVSLSEGAEKFLQSIKSLTDAGSMGEHDEPVKLSCSKGDEDSFPCSGESNRSGCEISQGSVSKQDDDALSFECRVGYPELARGNQEMPTFQKIEVLDPKGIDIEALGLLRWLASFQAAEDVNTDDDLVRDLFLTPLLPKSAINDVLEKANMDYECESQQECQDILDSVDDTTYSDIFKERAVHSTIDNHSMQIPRKTMIPQVDGSGNEELTGHVGNPSEAEVNNVMGGSSHQVFHSTNMGFSSERRKSKKLWGTLPLVQQKVNDALISASCSSADLFGELKSGNCPSSSTGTKVGECLDNALSATTGSSDLKEGNNLIGCTMRDLMRKKRCRRVEPFEDGTCGVKKVLRGKELEETFLSPKRLFPINQNDVEDIILNGMKKPSISDQQEVPFKSTECTETSAPQDCMLRNEHFGRHKSPDDIELVRASGGSHCVPVTDNSFLHTEKMEVPKFLSSLNHGSATLTVHPNSCKASGESDVCIMGSTPSPEKSVQEGFSAAQWAPDSYPESQETTNVAINTDVQQIDNCASVEQHIQNSLSSPDTSFLNAVLDERRPTKCIEMAFSKKPPMINWMDAVHDDTSFTFVMQNNTAKGDMKNCEEALDCSKNLRDLERSSADGIFPFFSDGVQDEKEIHCNSFKDSILGFRQDAALGVSTHYQNDGSCLYLLTTTCSPPSVDSVNKWLLERQLQRDATGTSIECAQPSLSIPVSPKNSSSLGLVDKENNSLTDEKIASEFTTELQDKGTIMENCQDLSQISGPDVRSKLTPLSQIGFRDPASLGAGQQLTLMSIEVQAKSRGDLRPDPQFDAVTIIAIVVQEDNGHGAENFVFLHGTSEDLCQRSLDGISGCKVVAVSEEKHLFDHLVKIIRSFDPDVLIGWEIQGGSLGFLAERAANLGVSLLNNISRTPSSETKVPTPELATPEKRLADGLQAEALVPDPVNLEDVIIKDEWGRTHASGVHVGGRIVLNIWRLMRDEVKLKMYTLEAVAEEVLRLKVPSMPFRILSQWFESGPARARFRCIEYFVRRAQLNLEIMSQLDMINRTSELARVFGIDFFSVLSRGSQYRVESMMLRLAHTQNYLAISPGNQQVASQPAMECLPLVMEPESGFYADPVVVLDFQSLYPSMIIAYNLCFCTCLGKVVPSRADTLGVSAFFPDPHLLMNLKDQILLTPNGVMYVPSKVRKGVLPRLLEEILSTRIMVKQAMKKLTLSQRVLSRIFNARQLALKLIANVTYGYTAAGFSGRMPCAELADSIVQCGRRTLEKAISFVNSHDKWKARVIYGDTDSMFVLLKGRTREEAFKIGREIASEVSLMNPDPVTLKMEKVYHPCFLLTKKRYVGYSYETPDQSEPLFDAKGIETVRRDSCEAVSKTLEKSLRLFFVHQDISRVKVYLQRQWSRILRCRVSLQDFIFAKEVRLGTYSARSSSLPPAAIVATKAMRTDPRAEPHYAERIPYVVIHGEPGARLVDMVVDPLDLLSIESPLRLNDLYYINKQIIPALQRVFGLVGADLNQWFLEMPRPVRPTVGKQRSYAPNAQKTRIDNYYLSKHCFLCGELVQASTYFCDKCFKKEPIVATAVINRTSNMERDIQSLAAICRHCGGGDWIVESGVKCTSLSCELFYQRRKIQKELQTVSAVATELGFYPKCMVEWY